MINCRIDVVAVPPRETSERQHKEISKFFSPHIKPHQWNREKVKLDFIADSPGGAVAEDVHGECIGGEYEIIPPIHFTVGTEVCIGSRSRVSRDVQTAICHDEQSRKDQTWSNTKITTN